MILSVGSLPSRSLFAQNTLFGQTIYIVQILCTNFPSVRNSTLSPTSNAFPKRSFFAALTRFSSYLTLIRVFSLPTPLLSNFASLSKIPRSSVASLSRSICIHSNCFVSSSMSSCPLIEMRKQKTV